MTRRRRARSSAPPALATTSSRGACRPAREHSIGITSDGSTAARWPLSILCWPVRFCRKTGKPLFLIALEKRDHFRWKHHGSVAAFDSLLARAILQENRYPLFPIALHRGSPPHCPPPRHDAPKRVKRPGPRLFAQGLRQAVPRFPEAAPGISAPRPRG